MAEEVKQDLSNVNISIEQIVAAILNKIGKIDLSLEELLTDYSSKNIAVDQDPDSQQVIFQLVDTPEEVQTENE
jgi:hypothetical protein